MTVIAILIIAVVSLCDPIHLVVGMLAGAVIGQRRDMIIFAPALAVASVLLTLALGDHLGVPRRAFEAYALLFIGRSIGLAAIGVAGYEIKRLLHKGGE